MAAVGSHSQVQSIFGEGGAGSAAAVKWLWIALRCIKMAVWWEVERSGDWGRPSSPYRSFAPRKSCLARRNHHRGEQSVSEVVAAQRRVPARIEGLASDPRVERDGRLPWSRSGSAGLLCLAASRLAPLRRAVLGCSRTAKLSESQREPRGD